MSVIIALCGSQPRKQESASHHAQRGRNAEAFLMKGLTEGRKPVIAAYDQAGRRDALCICKSAKAVF